jgi:hypothetical protein
MKTLNSNNNNKGKQIIIKLNAASTIDADRTPPRDTQDDVTVANDSKGEEAGCCENNNEMKEQYYRTGEVTVLKETKKPTGTTRKPIKIQSYGRRVGFEKEGEEPEPPKTGLEKFWSALKWSISILLHVLLLCIAIVHIGVAQQMAAVRANLLPAYQLMYPEKSYNNGTVCAWSNSTSSGITQTFATARVAYIANYSVIHCGECGACSNWNDLSILWTTRSNLSTMAQEW